MPKEYYEKEGDRFYRVSFEIEAKGPLTCPIMDGGFFGVISNAIKAHNPNVPMQINCGDIHEAKIAMTQEHMDRREMRKKTDACFDNEELMRRAQEAALDSVIHG
jgi:hypothetical protein